MYSRACHLLISLIHSGQTLHQLRKTSSWICLARLHRINPDRFMDPLALYQDQQDCQPMDQPNPLHRTIATWVPRLAHAS